MKLKLQDKKSSVELSDAAFAVEFKEALVHQIITAYLAGGRQGTKAEKNRAQVRGGGTKPWLGIIGATSWDVAFGSWPLRGLCLGR